MTIVSNRPLGHVSRMDQNIGQATVWTTHGLI